MSYECSCFLRFLQDVDSRSIERQQDAYPLGMNRRFFDGRTLGLWILDAFLHSAAVFLLCLLFASNAEELNGARRSLLSALARWRRLLVGVVGVR